MRRSGRQRKLLHHNFNESWITNELKVKGYPDLYGFGGFSSSEEFTSGDEGRVSTKRLVSLKEGGLVIYNTFVRGNVALTSTSSCSRSHRLKFKKQYLSVNAQKLRLELCIQYWILCKWSKFDLFYCNDIPMYIKNINISHVVWHLLSNLEEFWCVRVATNIIRLRLLFGRVPNKYWIIIRSNTETY